MDQKGENSPAKINMSKGKKDGQSQVRHLIEKLTSWRDESHIQMSNIISSHSGSIDKGFDDVVEEFSELQAQVSILRKERYVLLETIHNMNGEMRQMSAEVLKWIFYSSEVDIPYIKEECVESPRVQSETDDEARCVAYGDILDQSTHTQNKISISDDQSTPQL